MKEVIILLFVLIMALYGLYHFVKSTAVDILKTIHKYREKKGVKPNVRDYQNGGDSPQGSA